MKPKQIIKIAADIAMTIALLFLISHHILNGKWTKNLLKGKYTALRILQTALVILALFSMLGSMVSGIVLSRHILSFIPSFIGLSLAREMHMLSAYWGFVFMSLHLGFHWSMMMGMAKRLTKKPSVLRTWIILRIIAVLIAGYGVYAFVKRDIGSYLLLRNQFVFFDFEEPLFLFLFDYMAVMGLFVTIGHYLSKAIKAVKKQTNLQHKI